MKGTHGYLYSLVITIVSERLQEYIHDAVI